MIDGFSYLVKNEVRSLEEEFFLDSVNKGLNQYSDLYRDVYLWSCVLCLHRAMADYSKNVTSSLTEMREELNKVQLQLETPIKNGAEDNLPQEC